MIPDIMQLVEQGWVVDIGPHYEAPGYYCMIYQHGAEPGYECSECDNREQSYTDAEHAMTPQEAYRQAYKRFVDPGE